MKPATIEAKVQSIQLVGRDVYRLMLHVPDRPDFEGGQYLMLELADGNFCPFSIGCGPANPDHLELHIRLLPGHDFAASIVHWLEKQDSVRLQMPFGRCVLRDGERDVVIIAGGTGFSPMKALLEQALPQQQQRNFHLFWGAQTQPDLYLDELPQEWQQQYPHFTYTPVLSGDCADNWSGQTGLVHEAALKTYSDLNEYDVYLSGSEGMVLAVYQDLLKAGVPKQQIYSDMLDIKRDLGELD